MPEELGYEEIVWQLENCSMTYLPALLIRLNELVYSRKVLQPGGASTIAIKVEAKLGFPELEHDWFHSGLSPHPCCRVCGIVQRRDGKNLPCKGPTKIGLRESE